MQTPKVTIFTTKHTKHALRNVEGSTKEGDFFSFDTLCPYPVFVSVAISLRGEKILCRISVIIDHVVGFPGALHGISATTVPKKKQDF